MHCEYETIKVLRQIAPQYIPNAWLPDAMYHLPHFFMEFIDSMGPDNPLAGQTRKAGWEPKLDETIRDMAAFYMRLASVPFEGIGSFMPGHYTLRPDGIVAPPLGRYLRFGPWTDLKHPGPYTTSREMWLAAIDFRMLQIDRGAIVTSYTEFGLVQPTFITHADPKADMFLLRDDSSIAAVVDWDFAYTVPMPEMFSFLFGSGGSELQPWQKSMCDIFVANGFPQLASALRGSHKYRLLNAMLAYVPPQQIVPALCNHNKLYDLRRAFLGVEVAGKFCGSRRGYIRDAMKRHAGHEGLAKVIVRVRNKEGQAEEEAGGGCCVIS